VPPNAIETSHVHILTFSKHAASHDPDSPIRQDAISFRAYGGRFHQLREVDQLWFLCNEANLFTFVTAYLVIVKSFSPAVTDYTVLTSSD